MATIRKGDSVTFDTMDGDATGIVFRVWENGIYVSIRRYADGAVFVRLISETEARNGD